ncbi:MAG: acyl carrier protein [Myxococcota bacterium]
MSQPTQEKLIELAAKRFGKDASKLQPEDDFFDALGIDSYKAMDLLTEVEESFDIEIPDYELQGVNTFAGLSEVIERRL